MASSKIASLATVKSEYQEDGRHRLLHAAVEEFSAVGFAGASLRKIAGRANAQHQLIVHHFQTKEVLWRAVVSDLMEKALSYFERADLKASDAGPAVQLRERIRALVSFTAKHCELHRILTFEGRIKNPRLDWLLDAYLRKIHKQTSSFLREAQKRGEVRPGRPGQLVYAMLGIVTTSMVFAEEYRETTGSDPFSKVEVNAIFELACDFLGLSTTD
jgi:TetR/AcrR family transcriptional regulator